MKKILMSVAILGAVACSKDSSQLSNAKPSLKDSEIYPESKLPDDEESNVVSLIEDFYSNYADYVDQNYDGASAPSYDVGYGIALLEASINAAHFDESDDPFNIMLSDDEALTYDVAAGTPMDGDNPQVTEEDLLILFGDIMDDFGDAELAPMSHIELTADVANDGSFSIKFTPARVVYLGAKVPIGTDGQYHAKNMSKCDNTGNINAAERLEKANFFNPKNVWFYNTKLTYCHDENNDAQSGPWDYVIYYKATNSVGAVTKFPVDPSGTQYFSNFLGGEYANSAYNNNPGANRWQSGDCVENTATNNEDMVNFDLGIKEVFADYASVAPIKKWAYLDVYAKEKTYLYIDSKNHSGQPYAYHGMSWVSATSSLILVDRTPILDIFDHL